MAYKRVKGGEKNALSGTPFKKSELEKIGDLYISMNGKGIHENNPKIHALAEELGRTIRSVENQLLGFRSVATKKTGRKNFNSLIPPIWRKKQEELKEKEKRKAEKRAEKRKNQKQEFKFRISAQLKNLIGKELITDDYIAVFELVKNSFDAHANNVKITFGNDKIIITDDGKGMDKGDLINKWLFVAYSAKKEGIEDEELKEEKFENYRDKIKVRKYYAGAKGIGRFSSDKLGAKLKLITKKAAQNSFVEQLTVNWERFEEDAEDEFVDVEVNHETLSNYNEEFKHGLILEISNLHNVWPKTKILTLKQSLEKLINPFDVSEAEDKFKIEIIAPKYHEDDKKYLAENKDKSKQEINRNIVNGYVNNFVFETLSIKTTQILVSIQNDKIITKLEDRGELVYEIEETNNWKYLDKIRVQLFYLNTSAKINFNKLIGVAVKNFGSIFLYNNGFRVYPYGEPDNDPFNINVRKAQGYSRYLGTRELIGRIEIIDGGEQFKETTSRDKGLEDTLGTKELELFFKDVVKKLEKYVVDIQWPIKDNDEDLAKISQFKEIEVKKGKTLNPKLAIINLINKLVDGKDVKLLKVSSDFLSIMIDKSKNIPPIVFDNLEKIAKTVDDDTLLNKIDESKKVYLKVLKEKKEEERKREIAEKKATEEEKKRKEAEQKAAEEEKKRKEAEEKEKAEREKRLEEERKKLAAERKKLEAEKQAAKAERERLEAVKKTIEIERKRQEEEKEKLKAIAKAKKEREKRLREEKYRKQRENQVRFLESIKTLEIDDLINLNHQIGIDANTVDALLGNLKRKLNKKKKITPIILNNFIDKATFAIKKILSVTKFTTKENILVTSTKVNDDIISFLNNYILNIYSYHIADKINIKVKDEVKKPFFIEFIPIEMTIIVDNLISNSRKKNARNVEFIFRSVSENSLEIIYNDDGDGLDSRIKEPKDIFERGITTTRGSGLGLYHVKKILMGEEINDSTNITDSIEMNGSIEVIPHLEKGIQFKITINNTKNEIEV